MAAGNENTRWDCSDVRLVTLTGPKLDRAAPPDVPEAGGMVLTSTIVPELVDREPDAPPPMLNEAGAFAASGVHVAKQLAVLSGATDDLVSLAAALTATLTPANHSQGSAATIGALRPAEPLLPGVEDPWTGPHGSEHTATSRGPSSDSHPRDTAQAPPAASQVSQDQPRRLLPSVRLRPGRLRQSHLRPTDSLQLLPLGGVVGLCASHRHRSDRCVVPPEHSSGAVARAWPTTRAKCRCRLGLESSSA